MVTADSVKVKIQGLIASANAKTGNTDADLTTAVNALIAGFGQGGGDHSIEDGLLDNTLTEYYNDRITFVRQNAFANTNLVSVSLPKVTIIGGNTFSACFKLVNVNLPELVILSGHSHFDSCRAIEIIKLPKAHAISSTAFINCSKLKTVVLARQNITNIESINAFQNTPFAANGTGGTVYVPSALIAEYQNATNWSTLYAAGTCNFVAIEGSEYE